MSILSVCKSTLPAILRNNVPKLRLTRDVSSLVATPSHLFGGRHSDVGKQVLHRGTPVTILDVHQDLRKVLRFGEEEHRAFWIPRGTASRREFKLQRIKRPYDRGIKTVFASPHYAGEAKPIAEVVPLPRWSNLELYVLTKSLAHITESNSAKVAESWMQRPARQERRELEQKTRQKYALLREKLRGRLLQKIISESRLSEDKQFAVYDVLALQQPVEQVATARNINTRTLQDSVDRFRTKLNKAYLGRLEAEKAA